MKNNKGFAISSIVYAMLILFLGLILLILANLASRKAIFDKEKKEITSRFNGYEQNVCQPASILSNPSAVLVTGDNNRFSIGAQYNCELGDGVSRVFYVLEETSTKVSLIMNENLDGTVSWISEDDYVADGGTKNEFGFGNTSKGPITATKALAEKTKGWNKLNQSQIKLPTGKQIVKAGDLSDWNSEITKSWLLENLYSESSEESKAKPRGYWTSTAQVNNDAWFVSYVGSLNTFFVSPDNVLGIRPVIELSKSSFDNSNSVNTSILCNAVTTATIGNVPQGNYTYGDEYTCNLGDTENSKNLTFLILEKNGDEVSLIMNKTLGDTVSWVSKEDYIAAGGTESDYGSYGNTSKGSLTVSKALKERTSNWNKISDKSKITLPTVNQIAVASNISFSGDNVIDGLSRWLYGDSGYWLSTSYDNNTAYAVFSSGDCRNVSAFVSNNFSIRPVITISTTQIK